jgi:hypothetical protein
VTEGKEILEGVWWQLLTLFTSPILPQLAVLPCADKPFSRRLKNRLKLFGELATTR